MPTIVDGVHVRETTDPVEPLHPDNAAMVVRIWARGAGLDPDTIVYTKTDQDGFTVTERDGKVHLSCRPELLTTSNRPGIAQRLLDELRPYAPQEVAA
ncbi:hypothetical protein [Bailinhaonella thermotolerans]|uniref:Uncharacterized protein n=1 Tax=Bailinhaonella thermotolerans TaxID=1070861 RepID=A0A3A4A7N3_9ACTN|nr:hypothetical protein [Bailinhaonella thermotolerans]RJL23939.1 hypothetical protein D5H75_31370 [Bailinhaonella thermotolerans]